MKKLCKNIELKKYIYSLFRKVFKFDEWHVSPAEEKPYAVYGIKLINNIISKDSINNDIVEVGCGLGDIISSIDYPKQKKFGYDISKNVINAARIVNYGECKFSVGTFSDIKNKEISILIAINFLHALDSNTVSMYFNNLIKQNNINIIIVDSVESPPYEYSHDYIKILGSSYDLEYKSRGFYAWGYTRRHILIFKRRKQ